MSYHFKLILLVLFVCANCFFSVSSQVSFELKTSPEVDFTFITTANYTTGITRLNALKLNVSSDRRWDMWVKSTSPNWTTIESYGTSGILPEVDMLELRVRNSASTALISGFFSLSDTEQYLIGTAVADTDVPCPNAGANVAGTYVSAPSCYEFFVDFRITPGIDPVNFLLPGLYRIEVLFTIVEDL